VAVDWGTVGIVAVGVWGGLGPIVGVVVASRLAERGQRQRDEREDRHHERQDRQHRQDRVYADLLRSCTDFQVGVDSVKQLIGAEDEQADWQTVADAIGKIEPPLARIELLGSDELRQTARDLYDAAWELWRRVPQVEGETMELFTAFWEAEARFQKAARRDLDVEPRPY
jgi:hypothetical protein